MDNFFFGKNKFSKSESNQEFAEISSNYSRTYSKGKSFKFSVWNKNDTYNNDEFVVDFVQWNKSLWAAKKTSTNIVPSEGDYWELVVKGVSDIEFRQTDNIIEYRYKDPTSEWKDLFELASVSDDQIKKMLEDLDIKYWNTYDTELSETSTNAVQNQAIAKKFKKLDEKNTKTDSELVNIKSSVTAILSNAKSYTDSKISETKRDVDTELEKKVDKVSGKGLSTNDFNNEYKAKLDNLNSSLNNTLSSAKSYTNSEITKVDNKINSEISRAKTSETNLSNRIDDLEEGLTNALNEAKEYTDSEVKNNTNKINILNGTGEGSVTKTVKDEIAKVVDAAPEELDTLREIAAKLADSEDVAAGLVETLSELETKKADKTALNNLKTETDSALQSLDKTKANTTGTYPSMRVGTADDLAGRGESVPAEFGFRASGGKSIKDGRAYIKRIKGNSVVWNQFIDNTLSIGKFKSGNSSNASLSVVGNVFRLTTLVQGSIYAYYRTDEFVKSLIVGHKYLRLATIINNTSSDVGFHLWGIEGDTNSFIASNTKRMLYNIFSLTNVSIASPYLQLHSNSTNVDEYIEFSNVQFIDLTQMFGAGNEPTTIEDFNARVATLGVDMNAYNEGQVIHCNTESIKSVGDNAWDEQWRNGHYSALSGMFNGVSKSVANVNPIKILPNSTYVFNKSIGKYFESYAFFYDDKMNFILYKSMGHGTFTSPSNAVYMNFYVGESEYGSVYDHDFTISLYHSGWKQDTDAGYQPYWQDILPLPIIRKYFPDGMKSAGTAHDEVRYNKASGKWEAVKRIGEDNMWELDWKYAESSAMFYVDNSDKYYRYMRLLTTEYPNVETSTVPKKIFAVTSVLRLTDPSYTDVAIFKAMLQEKQMKLYYELAEPIVTELDAEDQNFRDYYNVADFGTEMSQSSVPSAPFSADIIYQFNAVDMIREHELEITELQNVIATMQAQLASLTSN